jgi:hypothetical protein
VRDISKLGHVGGFVAGGLAALAIAGLPSVHRRLRTRTQVAGLAGVAVVVAIVIATRTAFGSSAF